MIEAAGGHAHVFGASSGAALMLRAAQAGVPVDRVVVYEAAFIVDDSHAPNDPALPQRMRTLVDDGHRGDAVSLFLKTVGAPGPMVAVMRLLPVWRKLTGVAHTLPYDLALVIDHQQGRPLPAGLYDAVSRADAGHRRRQEPGVPASRPGRRGRSTAPRPAGDAARPDPHDQGEGHRAGRRRPPLRVVRLRDA